MGKKIGKKRQQREQQVNAAWEGASTKAQAREALQSMPSEQLFVVSKTPGAATAADYDSDDLLAGPRPSQPAPKRTKKAVEAAARRLEASRRQAEATQPKEESQELWAKSDNLSGRAKRRKHVAAKEARAVPAVVLPDPGQSYNPRMDEHQEVLAKAVAAEREIFELRQAAQGKVTLPTQTKGPALVSGLGLGLGDSDSESDSSSDEGGELDGDGEGDDDEEEDGAGAAPRTRPLTKSERLRRARHKAALLEAAQKREHKKLMGSITQIGTIAKQLSRADRQRKREKEALAQLKADTAELAEPERRFGGKVVKAPLRVPVALTEELQGSMRAMKAVGNAASERFQSLHMRNKIELGNPGRRPGQKRKVKEIDRSTARAQRPSQRHKKGMGKKPQQS